MTDLAATLTLAVVILYLMTAKKPAWSGYFHMDGDGEYNEFVAARKNKTACLAFLVKLCHAVEREWAREAERARLLRLLR